MNLKILRYRIRKKLLHLRLQPIRVLCIHEVSEVDENSPDWIPTAYFKRTILEMQSQGYKFISLKEAYEHIRSDELLRIRKYAVLTADDGLRCHLEMLPWLEQHNVPITLCLNVLSLKQTICGLPYKQWYNIVDKEEDKEYAQRLYISEDELKSLTSNFVSFALHGVNHDEAATDISIEEFGKEVTASVDYFIAFKQYIPFFAYKYGKHSIKTDKLLWSKSIIPILADGEKNYNDSRYIHREILEVNYKKCQQKLS